MEALSSLSLSTLVTSGLIATALLLLAVLHQYVLRFFGVVLVQENTLAIVNKKFVLFGANKALPPGTIIALNGEAGWQAETLPPGVYFGYWPWQYEIAMEEFVQVPEGQVGVVESADGAALPSGRVLAGAVDCDSFQDAPAFLRTGGERGPQIRVIPPGTYRINTELFTVTMHNALDIASGKVGIVETMEGTPLASGDIAGPEIVGHNMFQDGHAFVTKGGKKGLQEQVMLAGRYYINPLFAKVTPADMTTVPIATVGVVIAYVGAEGKDVSGDSFKHGNMVTRGEKGVWSEPLDPGKYPVNPLTHKVELVPTANVVLNWANDKSESHKLDANLSTITVRSSDGFTFNLDVSQIIHIPRTSAPKVIARFGNMQNLVTQVLEPTIGNYFRNAAQSSDVIAFLSERQQRQAEAKAKISVAVAEYDVQAVDTLIGDIVPPSELMKTLTDRKIASQQQTTYETQKLAQVTRQALEQATAMAETQATVVQAERQEAIQRFQADAAIQNARGLAESRKIQAAGEAEATKLTAAGQAEATRVTGEADASRVLAVGDAEATVIKRKIDSMESGNYAGIEMAKALASSKVPLVPEIQGGHGNGAGGQSLIEMLLMRTMVREMNGHADDVDRVVAGR